MTVVSNQNAEVSQELLLLFVAQRSLETVEARNGVVSNSGAGEGDTYVSAGFIMQQVYRTFALIRGSWPSTQATPHLFLRMPRPRMCLALI